MNNHQNTKTPREGISDETDAIARQVVDAAFRVHQQLGPGLLESVYEICLAHELRKRGLKVEKQVTLPVVYDGVRIDAGLRLDLIVNGALIVELKAVEEMLPVHQAQMLTYLKLSGMRLGLLINFNVPLIKNGIKRIAFTVIPQEIEKKCWLNRLALPHGRDEKENNPANTVPV